jgi:hypothetical protein
MTREPFRQGQVKEAPTTRTAKSRPGSDRGPVRFAEEADIGQRATSGSLLQTQQASPRPRADILCSAECVRTNRKLVLRQVSLIGSLAVVAVIVTPHTSSANAPALNGVAPAVETPVEQATCYRRDYDHRDYRSRDRGYNHGGYEYRDRGHDHDGYRFRDHYFDRCRWVRHKCAYRWGWGGWEFRRCLWWRGCTGG